MARADVRGEVHEPRTTLTTVVRSRGMRRTPQMSIRPVVYRVFCLANTGTLVLPVHPVNLPHGAEDEAAARMQDR